MVSFVASKEGSCHYIEMNRREGVGWGVGALQHTLMLSLRGKRGEQPTTSLPPASNYWILRERGGREHARELLLELERGGGEEATIILPYVSCSQWGESRSGPPSSSTRKGDGERHDSGLEEKDRGSKLSMRARVFLLILRMDPSTISCTVYLRSDGTQWFLAPARRQPDVFRRTTAAFYTIRLVLI